MDALLPTTMRAAVERYLTFRRKLGVTLLIEGRELGCFARFADEVGHTGPLTTALAVRWATMPVGRLYHARRLDIVRRLARHLAVFDTATEIPPEGLLGPSYRRRNPHIYSDTEIATLLHAAAHLEPAKGLRPVTYKTLFGLLACAGLRISEALHLSRQHVDLETGIVTVIAAKLGRSRLVPLDQTATAALRAYSERRDQHHPRPRSNTFFLNEHGTSLKYRKVLVTFVELRRQLGWTMGRGARPPRIHDLRHAFVVARLVRWHEQGADIDRKIGSLSTYIGHVKVSNTYWYLTAVPELLAVGAARFEEFAGRDDAGATP